jgi:hypothetical protein
LLNPIKTSIRLSFLIILLFSAGKAHAQLPDSILIYNDSFSYLYTLSSYNKQAHYTLINEVQTFSIYNEDTVTCKKLGSIDSSTVADLIYAIHQPGLLADLKYYGYDDTWIKNNGSNLFNNIKARRDFWTETQKKFIKNVLSNPDEWKSAS